MRVIYNILFVLFFWLSAPWYFLKMWRRGNWRAGLGQRFGRYDPQFKSALGTKPVIWLHAVSVGEVGVCLQLLRLLEPRLPAHQFIVSTTTSTGMGELKRRLPPHIHAIYYPADFPGCVRRALDTIRPKAIVLVELELWPNLLWAAQDRGIPLMLVNARVSEQSFKGYSRFGFLFRPIFSKFSAVGCQNGDADLLLGLGFPADAVRTVGNMKFDAAKPDLTGGLDVPALLRQIGVKKNAALLVAGSTHDGEETILAEMWPRLRQHCPDLFLILVPRHFERAKAVAQELASRNVKFMLRGEIADGKDYPSGALDCLIVNSTGELKYFYREAALVFVGKSITAEGGQNPIEPAALGKAMVYGPNMQNFKAISAAFLAEHAAVQVPDAAALERAMIELLGNDKKRAEIGANALRVVQRNAGATAATVDLICDRLPQ